ncbi:MAG: hypothetical protein ABI551_14865, partial [Polyangiaceae bacterium]
YEQVGTFCGVSTVCHYQCSNGATAASSQSGTTPSIEALCGDAGLDAGSDGCNAFLAKCESGN